MISRADKSELFATLPPAWPQDPLPGIRAAGRKIIVLDDDPTGTQTVHAVPVLTTWDVSEQRDVVVFTSRALVTGADAAANLAIGRRISGALVELVKNLTARPRHLIAKGGITSSDLAKQGLGVGRARVLGQILPGVPVWELDSAAKFPGLPYIVFPGNVGDADALKNLVAKLSLPQAGGRRGSHRPSPRTGNRRGR